MTKKEIAAEVAKNTGITHKLAIEVIDNLLTEIKAALVEGDKVEIRGFGVFKIRYTKRKTARNLQTNTELFIDPTRRVKFIPGKRMRELVDE